MSSPRRALLVAPVLAGGLLLAGCSQAADAISTVQDAGQALSAVQDVCSQTEEALASGKPDAQIAEAFRQPLAELRGLLDGATIIPGLQGVVDAIDEASAALDAGTANTAELGQQIADACATVGQ
jgi:outer membrane murein-binding lipoprotein Lpp